MLLVKLSTLACWIGMAVTSSWWRQWINPHEDHPMVIDNTSSPWDPAKYHDPHWTSKAEERNGQDITARVKEAYNWTGDAASDLVDWTKDKAQQAASALSGASPSRSSAGGPTGRTLRDGSPQGARTPPPDWEAQDSLAAVVLSSRVLPREYVISLDMAGIPVNKMHVQVTKNQLLIRGHHEECVTGACWERSVEEIFDLPGDAVIGDIDSSEHLGVLTVRVPRHLSRPDREFHVTHRADDQSSTVSTQR